MDRHKRRWKVVLEAETPPDVGDWVAVSGMGPGEEEAAHFYFVDRSRAEGFTFVEWSSPWRRGYTHQEKRDARENGTVLWMQTQDCVEIVGVERLGWCPPTWSYDRPLWLLIVESLPTNAQFERRVYDEYERQKEEKRERQRKEKRVGLKTLLKMILNR